jgi:hypothetical protein
MLLKRRDPPGIFERIRVALWPRRNLARSARYIVLRLKRLQSSPHRIAVGAAAGVFAVWTPFLGLQLLLAAALSILLRGSVVASFLASFVGNPLTYPVIWFSTYNLGSALLGGRTSLHIVDLQSKAAALWDSVMRLSLDGAAIAVESLWPLFKPMLIGSLPLGGLAAFGAYLGVRKLLAVSNARRARKLMLAHRLT